MSAPTADAILDASPRAEQGPRLEIRGLGKSFAVPGEGTRSVLRDVELTVRPGEFTAMIGPSGCGKSTLFNIISGLEPPSGGTVTLSGESLVGRPGQVAYMPQKDLLFPWRTVRDNTILGLQVGGMRRRAARERVDELFATFGLDGYQDAYPFEMSGGMRQRAALLRTVVMDRPLLLLDEPFGALDSLTRTEMQLWLAGMCQRFQWTILLITHDIREAVFLADTVHVLSPRPATIVQGIEVDIPRPRGIDTFTSPGFIDIERRLLHLLEGGGAR
ncbi:ABC transporter [Frankia canadensis]|uniref:ABC transporter n=1 Tax=Frankia canadensis TaxID=1836972 RepID=A0A2I2KSP1_9ACTN|nr:ABC transporter ATP-binding protein [Frankia canadensis]SNQ48685.1 ABC transporter [Frankia canadensis]SOU55975.1 ABC transporter [Frankia canadensis]